MIQYHADIDGYYDMTEDDGFCHLGERDTDEETLQQEERNNFLTSVMQDVHQRFFH